MGLASSIGLGIAVAQPDVPVAVIDGDGNVLMNLGSFRDDRGDGADEVPATSCSTTASTRAPATSRRSRRASSWRRSRVPAGYRQVARVGRLAEIAPRCAAARGGRPDLAARRDAARVRPPGAAHPVHAAGDDGARVARSRTSRGGSGEGRAVILPTPDRSTSRRASLRRCRAATSATASRVPAAARPGAVGALVRARAGRRLVAVPLTGSGTLALGGGDQRRVERTPHAGRRERRLRRAHPRDGADARHRDRGRCAATGGVRPISPRSRTRCAPILASRSWAGAPRDHDRTAEPGPRRSAITRARTDACSSSTRSAGSPATRCGSRSGASGCASASRTSACRASRHRLRAHEAQRDAAHGGDPAALGLHAPAAAPWRTRSTPCHHGRGAGALRARRGARRAARGRRRRARRAYGRRGAAARGLRARLGLTLMLPPELRSNSITTLTLPQAHVPAAARPRAQGRFRGSTRDRDSSAPRSSASPTWARCPGTTSRLPGLARARDGGVVRMSAADGDHPRGRCRQAFSAPR